MNWLEHVHVLALAAILLLGPGLLLGKLSGMRGLALWAAAGPLSVTFASCTAIVSSLIGIPYLALPLGALLIASLVLLWWVKKIGMPKALFNSRAKWNSPLSVVNAKWVTFGLLLAFLIIGWRLLTIFGSPEGFSQTFDDVFHLNAVRFILNSGSGSSLTIGQMVSPGESISFYPAAWHDFVALVSGTSNSSIPAAANAVNLIISAAIWPAGCLFMVTRVTGMRVIPILLTSVLSAGFTAFPYLMLDFGVLYPYLLAVALTPFAIGLVITFLGTPAPFSRNNIPAALALVAIVPGLVLAHPSSLLVLVAFTFPVATMVFVRGLRRHESTASGRIGRLPWICLVGCYLGSTALLWTFLRPDPASATWGPVQSLAQSLGEGLLSSTMGRPVPWIIAAVTVVGVGVLLRRKDMWWMLGTFMIGVGLFAIVSSLRPNGIRSFLTGGWYNDSNRLAAILPIAVIGVAVIGGTWLLETSAVCVRNFISVRNGTANEFRLQAMPRAAKGAIAVTTIVVAILTQIGAVDREVLSAAEQFKITDKANLVSTDELALLKRAASIIPKDATVISNPWTGASLVYAFANRVSLTPHMFGNPGPDVTFVDDRLSALNDEPRVCEAVKRLRSYYVLDFGQREVLGGQHAFKGTTNLDKVAGITLVDSEGEARLYKITGCR